MTPLDTTELIRMLQAAARDEHAAIIQYLRHAYLMGEGELAGEIEGIAREEMRHFWILSRWIVRLGGDTDTDRGFTDLAGDAVPDWMGRDVAAEDRAIAMYEEYLTRIEDPDLRDDIAYILADERRHRDDFAHFVEKTEQEPPGEADEPAAPLAAIDREALDWGVQHEYGALLQYLVHSFEMMDLDEEVSSQLLMQAINEMQHMGWFGEELAESGLEMPLTHPPLELPAAPTDKLQVNIRQEQETAAQYARYLPQIADPGVKGVLDDARGQELYHEALFKRLLKRVETSHPEPPPASVPAPTSKVWTIGTLKKKE